ncbi:MAG: 30S ribosomal protein S5 [Janthinobacterium lividum]
MALINPDTLNLEERVIQTNKVQKTHKGGRTMSWSILVVVGDGNGYVGAGIGKARAIPDAIRKGVEAARKSLVHVPMVGSTIPHDVLLRQGGAEILIKPASPGTGVVAGGSVRAILEAAGVRDVLAKSLGSSNKVNTAWATIAALKQLKRATDVARLRGLNVNDLVSKAVADAAREAEQVDSAAGIASVVSDEPVVITSTEAETPAAETPVAEAAAEPVTEVTADTVQPVDASTSEPTTEGGA